MDYLEYLAFRLAVWCLNRLPENWSRCICRALGRFVGRVLGVRWRVARAQLAAVFPAWSASELDTIAGRVYEHLGESVAETFCCLPGRLLASVTVEPGWAPLDEAMAPGRGVIVVTAHLGNFELGGRVLAARYPLLDVVKPMRNTLFDRFLKQVRNGYNIATVAMDAAGPAVIRHLRDGGLVTLLVDQDAGRQGVRTDFLGLPASTWTGAARLAIRTGCPVIPVGILRQDDGTHVMYLGGRLDAADLSMSAVDIEEFTARISASVETFIRERPEQWFWVHRRWKGAQEAHMLDSDSLAKGSS